MRCWPAVPRPPRHPLAPPRRRHDRVGRRDRGGRQCCCAGPGVLQEPGRRSAVGGAAGLHAGLGQALVQPPAGPAHRRSRRRWRFNRTRFAVRDAERRPAQRVVRARRPARPPQPDRRHSRPGWHPVHPGRHSSLDRRLADRSKGRQAVLLLRADQALAAGPGTTAQVLFQRLSADSDSNAASAGAVVDGVRGRRRAPGRFGSATRGIAAVLWICSPAATFRSARRPQFDVGYEPPFYGSGSHSLARR